MNIAVAIVGPEGDERVALALEGARSLAAAFAAAPSLGWEAVASHAEHPWVLVLGPDERLTPELARELAELPGDPGQSPGYRIPIRMCFLGREIRGGRYRAQSELRLVHREHARPGVEALGWKPSKVAAPVLASAIRLEPFATLEDGLARIDREASETAAQLRASGRPARARDVLLRPPLVLARELIVRRGLRDGLRGLVLAALASAHELILYAKLWEQELPEHLRQVPSDPQFP